MAPRLLMIQDEEQRCWMVERLCEHPNVLHFDE